MVKTKLYNWDVTESLKTPEARAAYIEAAIEENDPEFLTVALGDVARAEGMSKVARKAKVGRENLYRAFAPGGNPTMATVMRVLDALGLTIRVSPAIAG
ncbi:MAG: putative addiction module antidote protein [Kiritimatiellae bacterium]|nr:putative addiction module antidote protein [Kiritimatiellia bacterium]